VIWSDAVVTYFIVQPGLLLDYLSKITKIGSEYLTITTDIQTWHLPNTGVECNRDTILFRNLSWVTGM